MKDRALKLDLRSPWTLVILGVALVGLSLVLTYWIEPSDVAEYARYARAGLLPPLLTHWPVEYPTLSEAVFLLPRLLPWSYRLAFGLWSGLALMVMLITVREPIQWSMRLIVYVALGGLALLTGRYDIFAVLAATLGIEAAIRDHFAWAWVWLAVGFLLKIYPAVFMPVVFLWQYRREGKLPWFSALTALLGIALVLELEYRWAGPGALSPYKFLDQRPLEIGSFPGAFAALLAPLKTRLVFAYGAMNIVSPLSHPVGLVFDGLMMLGLGLGLVLIYLDILDLRAGCLWVLVVLLLTSKVFSVQFILWLIPLWSYYPLNRYWLLAAVFSSLGYPAVYLYAVHHPAWWSWVIVFFGLRSVAILVGAWTVMRDRLNRRTMRRIG